MMQKNKKKKLVRILRHIIDEYREDIPEDRRGDKAIARSILNHFVQVGLAKNKAGKLILPEIAP